VEHVVIQDPKQTYANVRNLDILCRCRLTKHTPYDKVSTGDTVYYQDKGGAIEVKYTVSSVTSTPYGEIQEIRRLCKGSTLYDADQYWQAQQNRKYATVVWLADPECISPPLKRHAVKGNAHDWIVLDKKEKRRQWFGL
jgi:hypothetical protein